MIREIGNPNKSHRYTVQCVLPINLFNQQIFTFIWFWYVMVLIWNICGLIMWLHRSVPVKANEWIMRRVDLFNENVKQRLVKKRLRHFLDYYLEPDGNTTFVAYKTNKYGLVIDFFFKSYIGVFMIRMIANNTSDYVATDLIQQLWCQHHEKYGALFPDEPHQSKMPCVFEHSDGMKEKKLSNQNQLQLQQSQTSPRVAINMMPHNTDLNASGNYASFGQVYRGNIQGNPNQQQEYYRINEPSHQIIDSDTRNYPPSYITEENAHLIRKREIDDSSTKV